MENNSVWGADDILVEVFAADVATLHTIFEYRYSKKNSVLPPSARLKFETFAKQFVADAIKTASNQLQNQVMNSIRKVVAEHAEKNNLTILDAAKELGITL